MKCTKEVKKVANKKESAPYLKKESINENTSEAKEDVKAGPVEEKTDEKPVYRDPWNDLLFGKRSEPKTPVDEEAK